MHFYLQPTNDQLLTILFEKRIIQNGTGVERTRFQPFQPLRRVCEQNEQRSCCECTNAATLLSARSESEVSSKTGIMPLGLYRPNVTGPLYVSPFIRLQRRNASALQGPQKNPSPLRRYQSTPVPLFFPPPNAIAFRGLVLFRERFLIAKTSSHSGGFCFGGPAWNRTRNRGGISSVL